MHQNQVLLKGGHASKVVGEPADTRMVLMDGLVVKSHRLILASNSFLHQVISSSWIPGEISTFLLPQHSASDLLLHFPLLGNAFSNETGAFEGDTEIRDEGKKKTHSSNNETRSDFGEIKVEESDVEQDYIGFHENGDRPPGNIIVEFEHPIEPGEISRENKLSPGFEQTLKRWLRPESPSSNSRSGKRKSLEDEEQSCRSEFSAKDILEDDLIVELFGDNVTLVETVTTDHPDSRGGEFEIVNEESEVETRLNKTLVNLSSNNIGVREKRQVMGVTKTKKTKKTSKQSVDDPQELTSLEKELVQLERELTCVKLNQDNVPAPRLKVVGCQQRYTGIGGKRSVNKGAFWLVPSHRKAEDLDPLEETVLLIHVVRRGRPPLAIFIEESVSVAELITAVLEMHSSMEMQKEAVEEELEQLILSFAGYQLAPLKEIGPECYSRGATFVLSSSDDPDSKVANHSGHLLFCSECKPSRSKRNGRGWSAGWRGLAFAHKKMSEEEKASHRAFPDQHGNEVTVLEVLQRPSKLPPFGWCINVGKREKMFGMPDPDW